MLVMVCGLPGTGKTTLAKALAEKLDAVHISSDTVRMKMLEERTYSEEEKEKVYDAMLVRTEELLKEGKKVVLDATFYRKKHRDAVKKLARKTESRFFIVECVTHENLLRERIFARGKKKTESEADFGVYEKVKGIFEPIKEEHLVVDTSPALEKQVELVMEYLTERR